MGIETNYDENGLPCGFLITPSIRLNLDQQFRKVREFISKMAPFDPLLSFKEIRGIYRQCSTDDSCVFLRCTFD